MMNRNKEIRLRPGNTVAQMYNEVWLVQVLNAIVTCMNLMINGVIIGNFLDEGAIAVIGISNTMIMYIAMFSCIIVGGSRVLVGKAMGRGDTDEVRRVFSNSIVLAVGFGAILTFMLLLFTKQISYILGSNEDALSDVMSYLQGLAIGIIPSVVTPVLIIFMQMTDKSKAVIAGIVIQGATNLAYDLLAVIVFKGDVLSVAIATSLSNYTAMAFLVVVLLAGGIIRFKAKAINARLLVNLCRIGIPSGILMGTFGIRSMVINHQISASGGTEGLAALSILSSTFFIIDGILDGTYTSVSMVASVSAGEKDWTSISRLTKYSLKKALVIIFVTGVIYTLLAYPLSYAFGADKEIAKITLWFIAMYSLGCLVEITGYIISNIYQVMDRIKLSTFVYVIQVAVLAPLFAILVTRVVGFKYVFMCISLSSLGIMLIIVVLAWLKYRRMPGSMSDILLLSEYEESSGDTFNATVRTVQEAIYVSDKVEEMCKKAGFDRRKTYFASLCMEEMVVNVIEHGFTKAPEKRQKKLGVDVFVRADKKELTMRIRDNAPAFDPVLRLGMATDQDHEPMRDMGIRMVSSMADEMKYSSTIKMNVLNIVVTTD